MTNRDGAVLTIEFRSEEAGTFVTQVYELGDEQLRVQMSASQGTYEVYTPISVASALTSHPCLASFLQD